MDDVRNKIDRNHYTAEEVSYFLVAYNFLKYVGIDIDDMKTITVTRFLNRILGLPSFIQSSLFDAMADAMDQLIVKATKDGCYDQGIQVYKNGAYYNGKMEKIWTNPENVSEIAELREIQIKTCITWAEAKAILQASNNDLIDRVPDGHYGFYCARNSIQKYVVLAIDSLTKLNVPNKSITIYRPASGRSGFERYKFVEMYEKIDETKAAKLWAKQYDDNSYKHYKVIYLLSGSIFSIYNLVQKALNPNRGVKDKLDSDRKKAVRVARADAIIGDPVSTIGKNIEPTGSDDVIVIDEDDKSNASSLPSVTNDDVRQVLTGICINTSDIDVVKKQFSDNIAEYHTRQAAQLAKVAQQPPPPPITK